MTTHRVVPYYYYNPNDPDLITNRTKNRQYNITEKDYGDHKVLYYVPTEYGNNYHISQLDETPIYEEQQNYYSPTLVRRRYYNNDELPMISPRRDIQLSPRRPQVIKRTYYEPPPPQTVEYVYEDDYNSEDEYVVVDHAPRQRYIDELQPARRTVYIESPSPHNFVVPRRTSPSPLRLSELSSPRRSKMKQQQQQHRTPRSIIRELPNKTTARNNTEQKHISLKEIVAQNRAKRGAGIPKPRREVDEEELHDRPTYNKNVIKNGFIVYK